jgi:glycosyltransferase involved in cell wall biosynthesis
VCDLIDDPYLTWRSMPRVERFSLAGLKALISLQLLQRHILSGLDDLIVVGPKDAARLSRATGRAVSIVPNGVHADEAYSATLREPLVVFTGAMNFPPNEAAADHLVHRIWPHVRRAMDDTGIEAGLALVGANPTSRVKRLAQVPGVTVTGRVEDVRAWLRRALVAVAPMVNGSGIKNKILEACGSGCPVVTTPLGSEGLPIGEGICVADDPQSFGQTVADLLIDEARAQAAGQAGLAMVRERYSWSGVAETFAGLLQGEQRSTTDVRTPHRVDRPQPAHISEETLVHAAS